jgi:hypothetical protein
LVYGRLWQVDKWWRAKPAPGLPPAMTAAVELLHSNGTGLDENPRFLLAQDRRTRIVVVACAADDLGDRFTTDTGPRRLYCCVGWAASAGTPIPSLRDLRERFAGWAGPVYHDQVEDDWELLQGELSGTHRTAPAEPPWSDLPELVRPGPGSAPDPGRWPAADDDELWRRAAVSRQPLALSVGWASAPTSNEVFTHVAAANIQEHLRWPDLVLSSTPPPEPTPVPPDSRAISRQPVPSPPWWRQLFDRFVSGTEPAQSAPEPSPSRERRLDAEAANAARARHGSPNSIRKRAKP